MESFEVGWNWVLGVMRDSSCEVVVLVKPVEQTRFGTKGNCLAACIASILEVPLNEVPECDGGAIGAVLMKWLAARNLFLVRVPIQSRREDGSAWAFFFGYSILIAKSPREGSHAVVVKDGKIAHDPHPDREQGVADWESYFLFATLDASKLSPEVRTFEAVA